MAIADIVTAEDAYKSGKPQTSGTVGHLDVSQEKALKDLWAKILQHFETTKDAPIKVDRSLVQQSSSPTAAGIAGSDAAAVESWYSENKDKATDAKTRTVGDKLYLGGKHEATVPDFKPLFGDKSNSRTFYNAFWQATLRFHSPDTHLLWFLLGNYWDVDKAFDNIVAAVRRRVGQEIDRLMWEGDHILHQGVVAKGLTVQSPGIDRLGHPIFVISVRNNVQRERSNEDAEVFTAYALEQTALVARAYGERATLIYDFTGFKLENVDMGFSKLVMTTTTELYPGSISATLFYANSWLFSGIWKVLRGWMDPIIAKRTAVVKDSKALATFIERSEMPSSLGGDLDDTFKYKPPSREENAKMFDEQGRKTAEGAYAQSIQAFVKATTAWIDGSGATVHDAEERATATAAFDTAATELDPYVRARFSQERA
ncbi:hypothetical protein GGF46_000231 [Coemansia sp. RSA 552]|nr:hypothetical protein GGF46_000231 [Coemansia sp. RSA 552]